MLYQMRLILSFALVIIPISLLAETLPPPGKWEGTAPACAGHCDSYHFAYCTSSGPVSIKGVTSELKCAYAESAPVPAPKKYGAPCALGGKKAFCVKVSSFPQVVDYKKLNRAGKWRGTAPACDGSCERGEIALCRSSNGKECAYTPAIFADRLSNFGHSCSSGRKAFCVKKEYLTSK